MKQRIPLKQLLTLLVKLLVTGLCLFYVIHKIQWKNSINTLANCNPVAICLAVMLFMTSKVVSALRLNRYFFCMGLKLSQSLNLKLYWLGMFYNLFLPGGIGGDAYKVILLRKNYDVSTKKLSAAVLLDRFSGVVGLLIIAVFYAFGTIFSGWIAWAALIAIIPATWIYKLLIRYIFPGFLPCFWSTYRQGIVVQLLQVLTAYAIMLSFHIEDHGQIYIFLFLLSSIVAVLPLTVGGLGAREVVFLWGSHQFGMDPARSICISLVFYLITAVVSLIGLTWVYKAIFPKLKSS